MADRTALLRLFDELLFALRRGGFAIGSGQAMDVFRALERIGLADGDLVLEALAAILVTHAGERAKFETIFRAFFSPSRERASLWDRLGSQGFTRDELAVLRALLEQITRQGADAAAPDTYASLGALLEGGAALDALLARSGVARTLQGVQNPLLAGFMAHKVLSQVGVAGAYRGLGQLASVLRDALGALRGEALATALAAELARSSDQVRAHVRMTMAPSNAASGAKSDGETEAQPRRATATPFASLEPAEVERVRRAVHLLGERLRGGERVRRRRARRGRIDPHRTLRRALATFGVPFVPARRRRRRDQPALFVLCDVSDSVRAVAQFLLEFTYTAQDLFARTRSFVFVAELAEATDLFERMPLPVALAQAYGGGLVSVVDNSNYGRVLRTFAATFLKDVNRRATVVILGDGRSNYHEASAEIVTRIRERARAVLWLCTEGRDQWAVGDSAMARYAPLCTRVLVVRSAEDLERAARTILRYR